MKLKNQFFSSGSKWWDSQLHSCPFLCVTVLWSIDILKCLQLFHETLFTLIYLHTYCYYTKVYEEKIWICTRFNLLFVEALFIGRFDLFLDLLRVFNKPTCARVAAMTTVAHNTSKQLFVNAKANFSLLLPYAWCSLQSITELTFSPQKTPKHLQRCN